MKPRLSGSRSGRAALSLLATAMLFSGCRTPASQTLLEHENFEQEKTIEDLRDQIDEAQQDLQDCRRANAALKRQLGGGSANRSAAPSESSSRLSPRSVAPPTSPPPSAPPAFHPPTIDRGTEAPLESTPPAGSHSEEWVPPKLPGAADGDAPPASGATTSSYEEEAPRAMRISMIRLLTAGHQFGGHGASYVAASHGNRDAAMGDNGLQVAFTPRDAADRPVAAEGAVSMVVIDPALSGPGARVARWDFSPAQVRTHYRQNLFGKAYRFDLLWPHGAPQHERLKLFVRLTTADGEKLETNQTIYVRLGPQAPVDDSNVASADVAEPSSQVAERSSQVAGPSIADPDADSPAPHDAPPPSTTSAEISATGLAASAVATSPPRDDMGEFEPDEPAPADSPSGSANSTTTQSMPPRNSTAWRPDR
ncbi:MAG TPA: hypothetical protein VHX65_08140 [Pirellulales bacterium]|nr:hypothetical protein [Pirellulales bacterium]